MCRGFIPRLPPLLFLPLPRFTPSTRRLLAQTKTENKVTNAFNTLVTVSTLKIETVGAWRSIVGRGNGMETEMEHDDDDNILGMPQYTR